MCVSTAPPAAIPGPRGPAPLPWDAGRGPDRRRYPPRFLVFCSVHRFSSSTWNLVPETPVFPAFFLGALPVALSPLDTFMKLEVRSRPRPRFWSVLSCSEPEPRGGAAPHKASPSSPVPGPGPSSFGLPPLQGPGLPGEGVSGPPAKGPPCGTSQGPGSSVQGGKSGLLGQRDGAPRLVISWPSVRKPREEPRARLPSWGFPVPALRLTHTHSAQRAGRRGLYSSTAKTWDATGTSGPRRHSTSRGPGWTKASTRWEHLHAFPSSQAPFPLRPSWYHSAPEGGREGGREALATVC